MNTATPQPAPSTLGACAGAGLIVALALLLCSPAQAQSVRKCMVDGRIVFQSSLCAVEARVASAAPRVAVVDTPVAPKKRTLAELLRDRDASDPARPQAREFQGDGANVLRSRMGAV